MSALQQATSFSKKWLFHFFDSLKHLKTSIFRCFCFVVPPAAQDPTEKAGVCLPGFGTAKKDVLALAKALPAGSTVFLGRA
ncbi:MAG: hypothetical protein IKB79_05615, partial [Oscillospiraceae bacterium]|nr:hypothetical protein [Oscillospiraceae bacterium]